jgi:photosystem II stability/assembly factor-like uncharacterized protein
MHAPGEMRQSLVAGSQGKSILKAVAFVAAVLYTGGASRLVATEPQGGPEEFKHLKYRLVGPAAGGRVCRACGVPGDPLVYYAATASGGVWKSSDGGLRWRPIFDEQSCSSVGSIAVASSDPNVVYVGTGEANIRGNVVAGEGIFKSTDAGKTWKHVWKQPGQIGMIVVHPKNADIAFAAVLGRAFSANPERGIYRTTDGGLTWKQALTRGDECGASDVALDPSNPRIVFAGFWQTRRRPWELISGGPKSALFLSRDGGDTWVQLLDHKHDDRPAEKIPGKGLPEGDWGKVGVAVAPSDGRRVYALIEANKGGLFRSDDGGDSWSLVNDEHYLRQRAWYYSTITVDPVNPDVVWCPQVNMLRSIDGGRHFERVTGMHHGDNHDMWIDPRNPRRLIGSCDGGVNLSADGGASWSAPPLPISQFYHVAVDSRVPYFVSGCMQDLGSAYGPSNNLTSGGIGLGDWIDIGGGEAGFTVHDPTDPNLVYAGDYAGLITRFDRRTRHSRNMSVYPFNPSGHGAEDLRYRFQWTAPILISPHEPHELLHAANVLFRSTDKGKTWQAISKDLTRNDRTKQKWSGGPITGDNTGVEVYGTIFALDESPRHKGIIWTGSDDGLVHVSDNDGKTWTNVTSHIPEMPEWGTVSAIACSPFDARTAYVVVDAHRLDDLKPYLFQTTDLGLTWKKLSGALPQNVYLHAVREDPKKQGMLYVGTDKGVSFSRDGGQTWKELRLNLPTVPVHDLQVKDNDLVVGTHGRAIWILDDLTPLRAWKAEIRPRAVHLFKPQPAVRYRLARPFHHHTEGQNPQPGALVHYYLKEKPKEPIKLEIFDAGNRLVASFKSKKDDTEAKKDKEGPLQAPEDDDADDLKGDPDGADERPKKPDLPNKIGVNRFAWDLCYEGAELIPGAKVDDGTPETGPLASPGVYTLKLTHGEQTQTAALTVVPDPRGTIPESELAAQLELALRLRNDLTRIARLVKQVRSVREQLAARYRLAVKEPAMKQLLEPMQELARKLDAVEEELHNPKAKVVYDILAFKGGARLLSQLSPMYQWVKDGDGQPTQGIQDVYAEHAKELQRLDAHVKALIETDLAKLNKLAEELKTPAFDPHIGKE